MIETPAASQRAFSFASNPLPLRLLASQLSSARLKNIHRSNCEHHRAQLHGRRLLFALHNATDIAYININRRETGDPAVPRTFVRGRRQ
ncbi:hypothetical protein [Rhizobium etli]|uniref:hypothetical protein n=1 Tax=Rhizobium etli TaxID=29449 RepID=UPI0012BBA6FF|nr:hypothetical protein [Rhizobium etli]